MTLPPGTPAEPPANDQQPDTVASAGGMAVQQGTLPRAAIVGAAILGIVGVVAFFSFSGDTTAPMDRYLRRGPEGAAAALKRDMTAEFPAGSPVAPLLQRLRALGMDCTTAAESRAHWDCSITVRVESRSTLRLRAIIGIFGDKVVALDTAVSERSQ